MNIVLPARAGVIPVPKKSITNWISTTRTSGGDPDLYLRKSINLEYYPHERG